jgi:hypothetical protein
MPKFQAGSLSGFKKPRLLLHFFMGPAAGYTPVHTMFFLLKKNNNFDESCIIVICL